MHTRVKKLQTIHTIQGMSELFFVVDSADELIPRLEAPRKTLLKPLAGRAVARREEKS